MCGLAGVLCLDGRLGGAALSRRLAPMIRRMQHRGPDGEGIWTSGVIGLAHRRLAVIDLATVADQPMHTADGRLSVAFNGEIYNFRQLRHELEARGFVFRTSSDTEVLLHGYRAWGQDLPSRLRGMFAFALWDATEKSLFLARDRFGEKPLYYAFHEGNFLFASEAPSILLWPGFPRAADHAVINDYLAFGYVVGSRSAFAGIRRLPPGHSMTIPLAHGPAAVAVPQKYWELAQPDPERRLSRSEAQAELVARIDEVVRLQMISDVPLGAFLSGGVDSSAVVASIARISSQPVQTFSVGFGDDGFDETIYAETVAKRLGTQHRSFRMDHGLFATLPNLVWHYGEPFADSSSIVTAALARKMRDHVTVALGGDGGDELFLGYSRYARFAAELAVMEAGSSGRELPDAILPAVSNDLMRDRYMLYLCKFSERHKQWGYGPALADMLFTPSSDRLGALLEDCPSADAVRRAARVEVGTYLPDDLLVKTDRASMACALECRSPLLDHELADWASSLAPGTLIFDRDGAPEMKALLKSVVAQDVGDYSVYRTKQGFSVPVGHWLQHELRGLTWEVLTSPRFLERGYFRREWVEKMLEQHNTGQQGHGTRIWTMLCLELWHRTFLDNGDHGPLDLGLEPTRRHSELTEPLV